MAESPRLTSGALDMHSLIAPEFLQDDPKLVFHIFCYGRLDCDGEVDSNPEVIARSELRENLGTQSVPALRRNLPDQAEGCPLRFDCASLWTGLWFWLRRRPGLGGRLC